MTALTRERTPARWAKGLFLAAGVLTLNSVFVLPIISFATGDEDGVLGTLGFVMFVAAIPGTPSAIGFLIAVSLQANYRFRAIATGVVLLLSVPLGLGLVSVMSVLGLYRVVAAITH